MADALIAAGKRGITVAIPRNFLHVKLLVDNCPDVDLVVYRDAYFHGKLEEKFAGRTLFIDRELRFDRNAVRFDRVLKHNREYYRRTVAKMKSLDVGRFIIFLENEPLEVCLMDHFGMDRFELWEEGVMHYVDMFNPLSFRFRRLVQIASGFYPGHPLRTRIDRSKVVVRDRFVEKNLDFVLPEGRQQPRAAVAFLSNVLVEDNLVSHADYVRALRGMLDCCDLPFVYLPHPRENRELVAAFVREVASPRLTLEFDDRGSVQHCVDNDYRLYLSPFSTTLLDIQKFEKSAWVPGIFGLRSYQAALGPSDRFPIPALGTHRALRDWAGKRTVPRVDDVSSDA